jgi:hypothetical protein
MLAELKFGRAAGLRFGGELSRSARAAFAAGLAAGLGVAAVLGFVFNL